PELDVLEIDHEPERVEPERPERQVEHGRRPGGVGDLDADRRGDVVRDAVDRRRPAEDSLCDEPPGIADFEAVDAEDAGEHTAAPYRSDWNAHRRAGCNPGH